LISIVSLLLLTQTVFGDDSPAEKYALLIGISAYDHSAMNKPEPLMYPEEDARALGQLLKDGGYRVDLLLGKAATQKAIRARIAELDRQGSTDGVVLVGLFGHGVEIESPDEENSVTVDGCFCPFDTAMRVAKDSGGRQLFGKDKQPLTEPDPESLVKLSELMIAMKLAKAGNRVVLADCCRIVPNQARGRSFGGAFRAQDLPENTSVLFACAPNERAYEHPDWGHGAFTKCLLEEIRELSLTGQVETAQLAASLKRKVPQLVASISPRDRQTPKLFSTDSVDLRLTADDPDYVQGIALYFGLGVKINTAEAIQLLQQAADRDHPLATALLADIANGGCIDSTFRVLDRDEAIRLAGRALPQVRNMAEKGDAMAQYLLGEFHYGGLGVPESFEIAADWYRKASDQNFAIAQDRLAFLHLVGFGVQKDDDLSRKLYRQAADQNLAVAQIHVAIHYASSTPVNMEEANRWYRKAAEQNLASAQYELGRHYCNGIGLTKNSAEAVKWLRLAAETNHVDAQRFLGNLYYNGLEVELDLSESFRWYRRVAELGFADAQNIVGHMYELGNGVQSDDNQALVWFRKAASQNDAQGQTNLGNMYLDGRSVSQDPDEARSWYLKAAAQGFADAQNRLGVMYQTGNGVPTDYAEAIKWFRKAADQNDAAGQRNLGNMYADGTGVKLSLDESRAWYRKAAEQGLADAQNRLGVMYQNGNGVPTDYAEAIRWFRKSAGQNDAQGQMNMAYLYADGKGVEQDPGEALKWAQKAAAQNLPEAQNFIGTRYSDGIGVEVDYAEAARWFRRALNNPAANAELKNLLKENLKYVGATP
jgi:TPR repeat protein